MEKKLTKQEKGITLVALIITIIVLLILAIVSIRAIKDGGILSKTQSAKEIYSEAEEKEKIKLAINQAAIDGIGTIKESYLTPALNEQFGENNWEYTQKKEGEYLVVKIKASQRKYVINVDGTVDTTEDIELSEEDMFYYVNTVVEGFSNKGKEKVNNALKGAEVKIKIPQTLSNGTKITGIAGRTFSKYNVNAKDVKIENITSVEISYGVNKIEEYTFCGCINLSSITIPSSIQSIDKGAFWECTNLTDVSIPESVTSIGEYAFRDCTSLTNVTIPNGVSSIGEWTFEGCTALKNVTIPSGVIGESAFSHCTSLTNVTIGENVTSIGVGAFSNCTSLTNIIIPNSVTSIGKSAFLKCTSLTNVTIGKNVRSIGSATFLNCTSLTNVTIPNSVTSMEDNIFYNCENLTDIYCPGNASKPDGWDEGWQNGAFRNGKGEPVVVHWNESMPK